MDDLFSITPQPDPNQLCGGCGKVHADAVRVTLIDGTVVSNYSEAWRHECEARAILGVPRLYDRQKMLERIEKIRGKATVDKLRATMMIIWGKAQQDKSAG